MIKVGLSNFHRFLISFGNDIEITLIFIGFLLKLGLGLDLGLGLLLGLRLGLALKLRLE